MKTYFIDGRITEDLIDYLSISQGVINIIEANEGYTETLAKMEEIYRDDVNATVLTNCVHLLNFQGNWTSNGKDLQTLNPNVYFYIKDLKRFKRANELSRIRYENNIEVMYRKGKFFEKEFKIG